MNGGKRCARQGCDQPVAPGKSGNNRFCRFSCRAIEFELRDAQRLCSAIGPASTAAAELWEAVVAVNEALSEYQALDRKLLSVARSVGIDDSAWYGLKREGRAR